MSVKSLTSNCCGSVDNGNTYVVADDQLTNLDGNKFMDLSALLMPKCDGSVSCKGLKPNEAVSITGAMIALSSPPNNPFYVSTSNELLSNNSLITLNTLSTVVVGQMTTIEFTLGIDNDGAENTFTWDNFDSQPFNVGILSWNYIVKSWNYYSTQNSTTTVSMLDGYISDTLQIQTMNNEPVSQIYTLSDELGRVLMSITVCYDGVALLIESITVAGELVVGETTILDPIVNGTSLEYTVYFRDIQVYSLMLGVFMANYGYDNTITILNRSDQTIEINSLVASVCEVNSEETDCDCGCGC